MASAISLDGRVAIITGAAGGIGAATARLFVERGARVALADIDRDRAKTVADSLGDAAIALHVDLGEADTIAAMVAATVDAFGGLDILHNNAAYQTPEQAAGDLDVESLNLDVWDRTFAVNLRGTMLACRLAMPHLKARRRGSIINTVSNLGLQGNVRALAYSTSKAALVQLTRSIAASHGRQGVRCNAVAPGMTLTPALLAQIPVEVRDMVAAETLRDRLGAAEDIAEAVAFLASDAAANITAQCLVSDGGLASHVPGIGPLLAMTEQD